MPELSHTGGPRGRPEFTRKIGLVCPKTSDLDTAGFREGTKSRRDASDSKEDWVWHIVPVQQMMYDRVASLPMNKATLDEWLDEMRWNDEIETYGDLDFLPLSAIAECNLPLEAMQQMCDANQAVEITIGEAARAKGTARMFLENK